MTTKDKTHGLLCPDCGGVVPVLEGDRIVACPFCGLHSLLQGDHGVRRWQVTRQINRQQALSSVEKFFSGIKKAPDLRKTAVIKDIFPVYLPYWHVQADMGGWIFGRINKSYKKSTEPIEVEILERMRWNDAAVDVSEYGVHRVVIAKSLLEPYDGQALHAEALVFEPTESHSDALAEARRYFIQEGEQKKKLVETYFSRFHFLHERLSLVYYPLWVARYEYRGRNYQVVVDGVSGKLLYGKAPGNILYRAAVLVGGMASGTFILVNGTVLARLAIDTKAPLMIFVTSVIWGITLIAAGYRSFRYGEEVEQIEGETKKALTPPKGPVRKWWDALFSSPDDVRASSMMLWEESYLHRR